MDAVAGVHRRRRKGFGPPFCMDEPVLPDFSAQFWRVASAWIACALPKPPEEKSVLWIVRIAARQRRPSVLPRRRSVGRAIVSLGLAFFFRIMQATSMLESVTAAEWEALPDPIPVYDAHHIGTLVFCLAPKSIGNHRLEECGMPSRPRYFATVRRETRKFALASSWDKLSSESGLLEFSVFIRRARRLRA